MRNAISFLVFFLVSVFFGSSADAASVGTGAIQKIVTTKGGVMIVYLNSLTGTPPFCGTLTSTHVRYATKDHSQQSLLMGAYLAGHNVKINGDDNCDAWGDTETIKYAWVWP